MNRDAAIALAAEATRLTGDVYVAEIDYRYGQAPTFLILDHRGGTIAEGLTEEEVIADAMEVLDLADDVRARPDLYTPETRAAYGVETEEERAAREEEDDLVALAEQEAEEEAEAAAAREREAWSEYGVARDEAIYGPSEFVF